MTKNIPIKSIFIGSLLAFLPFQAVASLSENLLIEVRAEVPLTCALGNITANPNVSGVRVEISTSCNADEFTVNLDGVPDIVIANATISGSHGSSIVPVGNGVQIIQKLPGGQMIQLDLENTISEISGMSVSISAG